MNRPLLVIPGHYKAKNSEFHHANYGSLGHNWSRIKGVRLTSFGSPVYNSLDPKIGSLTKANQNINDS